MNTFTKNPVNQRKGKKKSRIQVKITYGLKISKKLWRQKYEKESAGHYGFDVKKTPTHKNPSKRNSEND